MLNVVSLCVELLGVRLLALLLLQLLLQQVSQGALRAVDVRLCLLTCNTGLVSACLPATQD